MLGLRLLFRYMGHRTTGATKGTAYRWILGSSANFAPSVDAHAVAAVTKSSLWIYYDLITLHIACVTSNNAFGHIFRFLHCFVRHAFNIDCTRGAGSEGDSSAEGDNDGPDFIPFQGVLLHGRKTSFS